MNDEDIRIRDCYREKRQDVVDVFATAMVDNPLHVAAYGSDPQRRVRAHRRLIEAGLELVAGIDVLCLELGGHVVGAAGIARPGACRPTATQRIALLPALAALGPTTALRVTRWLSTWVNHDPDEEHCHIGPVAVRAEYQGRGMGSRLMREVTDRLDQLAMVGYLETDRETNVRFYQRHGFDVVARTQVLGVENWFMSRAAAGPAC